MDKTTVLLLLIGWIVCVSLFNFGSYGADKYRAKNGAWRIPEKTLLVTSIIGGAIGGLIGMKVFRHKTKHLSFIVINWLSVIIHVAVIVYFAFIHVYPV